MKINEIKIRVVFFTLLFFISCHKFEENTLLFKNISVLFNSTTWELISYTKNGHNIYTSEKYRKYDQKSNNNLAKKGGGVYIISTKEFDSIKGKYYLYRWKIIKLNSKFLKIMRKDSANNVYIKSYKAYKIEHYIYYE